VRVRENANYHWLKTKESIFVETTKKYKKKGLKLFLKLVEKYTEAIVFKKS
jgi:hypothetical protein